MVAAKQQAGPQKCKDQNRETDNRHNSRFPASPSHGKPLVQKGRVKQPGNQGPHLFGIPLPVGAKRILSINGSGDYPHGQKGKAVHKEVVIDAIQGG